MSSYDSQSSPSSKGSASSSVNNKRNDKNGSSRTPAGNKKKSKDDKNNSKKKNKSNKNDKKSSSLGSPRLPSSSLHALSPPRKASGFSHEKSDSSESRDYDTNNVILTGAAIGAVLLLVLMIASMVCCCRKKKARQKNDKLYYTNKDETKVNDNNRNKQYAWNQHQQSNDLHLMMPPQPRSGPTSSEHGWAVAPPPMMSSSEDSGPYQAPLPPPHPDTVLGRNANAFTYDELVAATKGFNTSLLLGQGGFGYVHKGVLPNGKEIAVKSLKLGGGQWDCEFEAEFELINRVHHRHLVSVVGYCIAGQQRMLVYEFIPNKTLEFHLHGEDRSVMDCDTRLRIARGAAKGLAYLHEDCNPRIVHRDIKAANILIDDHFEAKVADFGLAKLSSETITHVSTRIMGTFGYLAPEYASTGKLTEKSDVFSFGVVLLELITGRRPINRDSEEDNLIDWARPIVMRSSDGGSFEELIDPRLKENYNRDDIHRMVACAAAAIRHSARIRPKMSQIVRVLEGEVSLDEVNEIGKNMHNTHLAPV